MTLWTPDTALVQQVDRDLLHAQGSRVRIYYQSRAARIDGHMHAVYGANRGGLDAQVPAHCIARVLRITDTHVLVQPDRQPRPVAIHRADITRVARVLLLPHG